MDNTYGSPRTRARRWTKSRIAIAAVAGTVLLAPGLAYAAVKIFGFGDGSVAGTTAQNLTIDNIGLVSPLVPGSTVDAKGIVHNPNNFAVTINSSIIRAEGLTATGGGNCDNTGIVNPGGTFNANQGPDVGAGWKINLAKAVTIPANGAAWITVPKAVSLSENATALCGFNGKFAVEGTVGGN